MSGRCMLPGSRRLISALLGELFVLSAACPEENDDDVSALEDASHDGGRDTGDGCVEPDRDRDGHDRTSCGGDDCDDGDTETHPGAGDRAGDGVDQDCDGADGVDRDRDGHASEPSGGDDCDDEDPGVHPGLDEDGWEVETVPDAGERAFGCLSVAAGSAGTTHVAYMGLVAHSLLLQQTTGRDGSWALGTVFDTGQPESNISDVAIVADAKDRPHVVDMDIVGEPAFAMIRHWSRSGGVWQDEDVASHEPLPMEQVGLAQGPDGALHVLFSDVDFGMLYWATNGTGEWVSEPIGTGDGLENAGAIAVDGSGLVHATSYLSETTNLEYVTNATGSWTTSTIAKDGSRTSEIIVDSVGTPRVVYLSGGEVRHGWRGEEGWQQETIDTPPPGLACSRVGLGVDPRDVLHVVYFSGEGQCELRYATNEGGSWQVDVLSAEVENTGDCGSPLAVAVEHVHVVYVDTELRHATRGLPDGVDDDCDGEVW